MEYEDITHEIISAAYAVHNALGSGFLEKVYKNALYVELKSRGFYAEVEFPISVYYRGVRVGEYIADLVINEMVIIELKAVENLLPIHETQLVNYLTGTGLDIGLLINFGSSVEVRRKYRLYKSKKS